MTHNSPSWTTGDRPEPGPLTDDEPWDCALGDDPLRPARGSLNGALLGCLAWVGIFGGAALLLSRIVR